jgi:anti-sigma-K factor RskA
MKQSMTSQLTGEKCEELLALIPAYALRATDPDETAFVEANLTSCPQAARALEDYTRLAAEMRADVKQVEPPSGLEERLMARLTTAERGQPRIIHRSRSLWVSVAAAVAVIALLVGTNAYWLMRVNELAREREALATQLQERNVANTMNWLTRAQWRKLEGTQDSNVLAVIIWEDDDCFLYTLNMPSLPEDQVYQLWLVEPDNHHVSAGTFRVDERGRGMLSCHAQGNGWNYARVGITNEPQGGSTDPTGNPVALGDV